MNASRNWVYLFSSVQFICCKQTFTRVHVVVQSSGPDLSVCRIIIRGRPLPTLKCYNLHALTIVIINKYWWCGAGVVVFLEQGADKSMIYI